MKRYHLTQNEIREVVEATAKEKFFQRLQKALKLRKELLTEPINRLNK